MHYRRDLINRERDFIRFIKFSKAIRFEQLLTLCTRSTLEYKRVGIGVFKLMETRLDLAEDLLSAWCSVRRNGDPDICVEDW